MLNLPPFSSDLSPNAAQMLWRAAERHGSRIAFTSAESSITYEGLVGRAAAFAAALANLRVHSGDRVAILLERGADAGAAFFGIAAAGGIAINLHEALRPRQIEHILEDAGVSVLLASHDRLVRLPRPLQTTARVIDISSVPSRTDFALRNVQARDAAQIIYTSGSTGLPKGVVVSHGNLWAVMQAVTSYLGVVPEDRIASLLPFSYTYGFNQLLCAVGTGASLVVENSPVADQVVSTLRQQAVTVLGAVPPLWLQLLRVPGFSTHVLPALRVMTNAGGRLPIEAVRSLRKAQPHAQLFLMYGMTETLRATYLSPEDVDERPDSIGRPIPGTEIFVLREDGSPCAANEVGELVQRGPTVGLGYWGDPEGTARVFRPHPLRPLGMPVHDRVVFSGDLVRRDEEGFLYHLGRRDRMIKTLGHRVSPDEVVDVLHASGHVVEAVITTEPDPQRGARIIAHVVLAPGSSQAAVTDFCRRELPRYLQPARIEVRAELPRTASGKHDVEALNRCAVPAETPASANPDESIRIELQRAFALHLSGKPNLENAGQ